MRKDIKILTITFILAALMTRASFWQWDRYQQKLRYIKQLEDNFTKAPIPLIEAYQLFNSADRSQVIHRRVIADGEYDYSEEIIVRNRKLGEMPGVFVVTPLKVSKDLAVLVNRGFVPFQYADPSKLKLFHRKNKVHFTGLVKSSQRRRFLAPRDAPSPGENKIKSWLRIDVDKIAEQIPYKIMPFYLEIADGINLDEVKHNMIDTSAGREELFFLAQKKLPSMGDRIDVTKYPKPVFSTVIPPGRHLGYVYEWAIMAFFTLLIGIILTIRARRTLKTAQEKVDP